MEEPTKTAFEICQTYQKKDGKMSKEQKKFVHFAKKYSCRILQKMPLVMDGLSEKQKMFRQIDGHQSIIIVICNKNFSENKLKKTND